MPVFSVTHRSTDTGARCGLLSLPHAPEPIPTPVFMPVGTRGTVKAMTQEEVWELGYRLILGNTYHLYLRPGHELVRQAGGLHKFIAWDGAILTDSGGLSGLFAGRAAEDHRGRRQVQIPSGRDRTLFQPRTVH